MTTIDTILNEPVFIPYNKSKYDRDYIVNGINSDKKVVAERTSNFMIDNILRYSNEKISLTKEGYIAIQQNWEAIKQNSTYRDKELTLARNYLLQEHKRLEKEARALKLQQQAKEFEAQVPKYHINIPIKEKPKLSIWKGFKTLTSKAFSLL